MGKVIGFQPPKVYIMQGSEMPRHTPLTLDGAEGVVEGSADQLECQLAIQPGQLKWLTVTAKLREDVPPPPVSGSRESTGASYLFSLPYRVYLDSKEPPRAMMANTSGSEFNIYPPFANGNGASTRNPIDLQSVPVNAGARSPASDVSTTMGLYGAAMDGTPCNALRFDAYPPIPPDKASRIAGRLLSLIRMNTCQWWIERDERYGGSHLVGHFPVNELGERVGVVSGFQFAWGSTVSSRPLSYPIFLNSCKALVAGWVVPLSWESLLDACYFHAIDDNRRAVLEMALGAESRIWEAAMQTANLGEKLRRKVKKEIGLLDGDPKNNVRRIVRFLDPQGAEPLPDSAQNQIDEMWIVRGRIAHGKAATVGTSSQRPLCRDDVTKMINATIAFFMWVNRRLPHDHAFQQCSKDPVI